jgi:hypothetical protein
MTIRNEPGIAADFIKIMTEHNNKIIEDLVASLREIEKISSYDTRLGQNLNACNNIARAAIAKATR